MSAVEPTVAEIGEQALLDRILRILPPAARSLLGPGDDSALLAVPDGRSVITTDVMVEGPDFLHEWSTPAQVGWKAAASNLADVAAMGATPSALLLVLALPGVTPVRWVEAFCGGLRDALTAMAPQVGVIGGDLSTAGQITVTVTAFGELDGRAPVLRSGAGAGDAVALAGDAGLSAAGWTLLRARGLPRAGATDAVSRWLLEGAGGRPAPEAQADAVLGAEPGMPAGADLGPGAEAVADPGAGAGLGRGAVAGADAVVEPGVLAPGPAGVVVGAEAVAGPGLPAGAGRDVLVGTDAVAEPGGLGLGPGPAGAGRGALVGTQAVAEPGVLGPGPGPAGVGLGRGAGAGDEAVVDSGVAAGAGRDALVRTDAVAEPGAPADAGPGRDADAGSPPTGRGFDAAAIRAHLAPTPPIAAGLAAAAAGASAMLDVSDGLLLDASRLARASGVRIELQEEALAPDADRIRPLVGEAALAHVLGGGEDHALLATFPPGSAVPAPFRVIGTVRPGAGVSLDGVPQAPSGWDPYRA